VDRQPASKAAEDGMQQRRRIERAKQLREERAAQRVAQERDRERPSSHQGASLEDAFPKKKPLRVGRYKARPGEQPSDQASPPQAGNEINMPEVEIFAPKPKLGRTQPTGQDALAHVPSGYSGRNNMALDATRVPQHHQQYPPQHQQLPHAYSQNQQPQAPPATYSNPQPPNYPPPAPDNQANYSNNPPQPPLQTYHPVPPSNGNFGGTKLPYSSSVSNDHSGASANWWEQVQAPGSNNGRGRHEPVGLPPPDAYANQPVGPLKIRRYVFSSKCFRSNVFWLKFLHQISLIQHKNRQGSNLGAASAPWANDFSNVGM
jgi:hypothetical protein